MDIDNLIDIGGLLYAPNNNKPYTGIVFDFYENGTEKLNGRYRKGIKNGKWTYWNSNGQKRNETTYKDGKKIRIIEWEYYENGQKRNAKTYKEGQYDGKLTIWYENGQKKQESTYKDGKPEEKWTEWYDNGQKQVEATFKDDKRDRLWTWWYQNGQKRIIHDIF